jgi:hypothetical protein
MAFADFDWATDANYPAGSETWSGTSTKVAPSAGVQADGFAPEDQPPAQWINWLFNGIVTAGQALELRGLQEAWDQSETNGDTTPHIDVGTQDFVIGGTSDAEIFKVANTSRMVTAENLTVTHDTYLNHGETHLSYSSGVFLTGGTAAHRLLSKDASGQVVEYQGIAGAWTPSVASVSGTGVTGGVGGDVSSPTGRYQRLGNVVMFTLRFGLDTTGWSGACTVEWDLPVSGTISGTIHGVVDPGRPGDAGDYFTFLTFGGSTAFRVNITPGSLKGSGLALTVSGSYLLA